MKLGEWFYKDEIIDGVYVPRELKKVWAINLDLLDVFQKFCQRNKLCYFIGYGTLLGAFRHQGFVPWDDDVDILMPRLDFERLKQLWRGFDYPYFLQNELSEQDFWYRGMMKFRRSDTTCLTEDCYKKLGMNQGIGLEVMPLDSVSDIPYIRRHQEQEVGRFQRLLWVKHYSTDFYGHGNRVNDGYHEDVWEKWQKESERYDSQNLQQVFLRACRKYEGIEGKDYALFIGYKQNDAYSLMERKWFADTIYMDFYGLRLPAPIGFWECLEYHYGKGFMSFVPPCEQRPHHAALWDTEVSYSVWQERLENVCRWEGKQLFIFGTGSMAEAFWQIIQADLPKKTYFIDNNVKMQGRLFHGCPVYAPDKLLSIPDKHIIICNGYYREIGKQLEEMGIDKYYVWVDDKRALFRLVMKDIEKVNRNYRIGGVYVKQLNLNGKLLNNIKKAKDRCEYLLAFVDEENQEMQEILKSIIYINRVIIVHNRELIDLDAYFCEKIFEFDG